MKTTIVSLKNGMGIELSHRDHNYIKFLKEFDPSEDGEQSGAGGFAAGQAVPDFVIIACVQCGVKNKVSRTRLSQGPKCGKCGAPLSTQH